MHTVPTYLHEPFSDRLKPADSRQLNSIVAMRGGDLSAAIHSKKISCVEVMRAYLEHIHSVNPKYNAIVSLRSDEDLLLEAAAKDDLLSRGQSQGWMHGFPQAPKDLTATQGLTTTMGFRGTAQHVPTQDSIVAARMRAAGSIFVGKTNTPEFGLGSHTYNSVFGVTRNAFDHNLSAGGSSGGAAVALALNMLPVADGSDMMGSLRNPAAWNGVYGLRPSIGRVPYGTQAAHQLVGDVFFQQLGIEGPMARCVEDLAQLLIVQAGYDSRAPLSRQNALDSLAFTSEVRAGNTRQGTRLAWLGDLQGHLAIQNDLSGAYFNSLAAFETLGCRLSTHDTKGNALTLPVDLAAVWQTWLTLRGMTVAGNLSSVANHPDLRKLLKPEAVWEFEQGRRYTAHDVYQASAVRSALFGAFLKLFEDYDYVVLPAAQCTPFDVTLDWPKSIAGRTMDTYHRWMECTIYATLAGLPALAVPAGTLEGIPFGLQIIGKPNAEHNLLRLGYAWQQQQQQQQQQRP